LSERQLIEFGEETITVNVVLDKEQVDEIRIIWGAVDGIQAPLIETFKNGLHLFIPWILKEKERNAAEKEV